MPHTSELRGHLGILLAQVGTIAKSHSLAGDTGYAKALETVVSDLLYITRGWEMSDANVSGPNEPAIDLIRADHQLAVQVTIDATAEKARMTSKNLIKSRFNSTLREVIVTGVHNTPDGALDKIDNRVRRVPLTKLLAIYDPNTVTGSQIEKAWEYLERETKVRKLLAADDREAFDYVLSQLRCGAIRHMSHMEGNYSLMHSRFRKLRELILNGTVADVSHPGKPAVQYEDRSYRAVLTDIADLLQDINLIVDHSGVDLSGKSTIVDIGIDAADDINSKKRELMQIVDNFCKSNGHSHDVTPVDKPWRGDNPEED